MKYSQLPYMPTPRLPYQMTALILPIVVPKLLPGARIHRIHMIRNGEIQNPVHHQRRRFDLRRSHAPLQSDI